MFSLPFTKTGVIIEPLKFEYSQLPSVFTSQVRLLVPEDAVKRSSISVPLAKLIGVADDHVK